MSNTKTVDAWYIEYARRLYDIGPWEPAVIVFTSESEAVRIEVKMRADDDAACLRITGPHKHEIPA